QDRTHLVDAKFGVEGVNVVIRRDGRVFSAETDERGVFAIENLPLDTQDGLIIETSFAVEFSHPDYLPLDEDLILADGEGVYRIVRELPQLAAGGFLEISIAVTDQNGSKTAGIGALESLQNLRTMDLYDARFLEDADTVEIPNLISIRARPGQYRARVCPETPGLLGCFDHFWTSTGGIIDTLDLSLNCGVGPREVRCGLDGGINAVPDGHIQVAGYVYSASTGDALKDARVTVSIDVLTEYCSETCTGLVREFSATAPTGPNGRYQINFQIPESNAGADLTGWSWEGGDQLITVTSPGHETAEEAGPPSAIRGFSGSQDFYLTPSVQLNTLIVGATSEGLPVSGFDPGLGSPITAGPGRATITLSPLGADLGTGSDGSVSFKVPAGTTSVIVNAPGHYPYAANGLVVGAGSDESAEVRYTLPIEQIPPALVLQDSFEVTHLGDGRPLKGFVLRGLSSPATSARWEVTVNRNGVRPLRNGFGDPVESVDLVIHVSEACPGTALRTGALQLRGGLLSGSADGVGTWGGQFDVADLPCGVLGWRVEARTSRSFVTLGFDWPLWPSGQRYPLSLLVDLAGLSATAEVDRATTTPGSSLSFDTTPGTIQISRDGEYLRYEIPDIAVTSNFGPPKSGSLLAELSGAAPRFEHVQAPLATAILDGATGLLDLVPSAAGASPAVGSTQYAISAEGLFSIDSSATTAAPRADRWNESFRAAVDETRDVTLDVSLLPPAAAALIARTGASGVDGGVTEGLNADASWDLAAPPPPGIAPPIAGQRSVVPGTRFEIVSKAEFEFGTSVMSHLKVDGRLDSRSVPVFAVADESGSIREAGTVASGGVAVSSEVWSAWISGREMEDFTFFDRDAGPNGAADSTPITATLEWSAGPETVFSGPGQGIAGGILGTGGLSRPAVSAARDENGKIFIPFVSGNPGSAWPGSVGLSLLQAGSQTGVWSSSNPVDLRPGGMAVDTAVTFGSDGGAMLVWSAIPDVGDDPRSFIHRASGSEIYYSRLDAGAGIWSEPQALTADDRPDFAPVIAADGDGRLVLAWARDMDGNVTTADDIVVYASEWVGGRWSTPSPVMHAPGAVSELSVSAARGTAVVGVVADAPQFGRSVVLSFNSLGRWSPVSVLAGGRQGLTDVAVLMDRPGLAVVAWNETDDGEGGSRIVVVDATSAGVRGEVVIADAVQDFVDLALIPVAGVRHIAWVSDGGLKVYGSRQGLDGWSVPSSADLPSGQSSRLIAMPGENPGAVLTVHETDSGGTPGLSLIALEVR
ncbi:MAG: hypothetical protein O3C10_01825, partial [Chloroflexi bacterium]|nr:hypothetical protein [Chloroflexota bacterium]